jgi:uncharacterized phage-associated protein
MLVDSMSNVTLRRTKDTTPTLSVLDVADYLLSQHGYLSMRRLEYLCFYIQAWSLAWNRGPVFSEQITAEDDGPSIRALRRKQANLDKLGYVGGDWDTVHHSPKHKATITDVFAFYADRSLGQLHDLSTNELPWELARKSLNNPYDPFVHPEITLASLSSFYGDLWLLNQK